MNNTHIVINIINILATKHLTLVIVKWKAMVLLKVAAILIWLNVVHLFTTRWTFFRVKLVFECDFEMSWSLCPLDPRTFGLLDLFPPPLLPHTSSYLLLSLPPTLLLWYGLVWGRGGWVFILEIEMDYCQALKSKSKISSLKKDLDFGWQ